MMISLTVDEAVAIYIAGQAVKLEYELNGESLVTDSYLALASAVRKMDLQLWEGNPPRKAAE